MSGAGLAVLLANHLQADDDCRRCQRVERPPAACAPTAAGGRIVGPYTYLAVYAGGRSRTIYVPATVTEIAEQHVEASQRNEALLAEISQINLELLRRRALE